MSIKTLQTEDDRMQGISSQGAVDAVGNRYDLVLIGARRVRELSRGDLPKVASRRGPVVTALKEIESGLISTDYLYRSQNLDSRKSR